MSDPTATSATLRIDAVAGRLVEVRAFIRAHAATAGADHEATADLVQAVDELVCNVIEHGYEHGPGSVEIEFTVRRGELQVRLRDAAPPFDPRTVPTPRLDRPLAQRGLGGMGVHLARTMTDRIDHRILPGGGNEVTIHKRLGPTGTGGDDDGHHDRAAKS